VGGAAGGGQLKGADQVDMFLLQYAGGGRRLRQWLGGECRDDNKDVTAGSCSWGRPPTPT